MDRLTANQQLNVNDQLLSGNGDYRVVQQEDGNLVLYRVQDGVALWASRRQGEPIVRTVMQADGNLVSYSAAGTPYWNTATYQYPGATAVLQDDGNFVIYAADSRPVWASKDFSIDPNTINYTENGFHFTEVSPSWRQHCAGLPCILAMQWPPLYTSRIYDATFDGEPFVIQVWKGRCDNFLGLDAFPGGVGLEVGVYRRVAGWQDAWWPVTDRQWRIRASFIDSQNGDKPVFEVPEQRTWWLTKWMRIGDFERYQGALAFGFDRYRLDFTVNGQAFERY